jgi:tetratricopeptide (TPR) repeat protein
MYFQLLKENLFTIDYNQETEIKKFIKYYRQQYSTNEREMRTIERFERIYSQKSPIYWYTLESFIYRTLNAALRTVDVGSLIKMRFFIRDLHQEIKQRHSQLRSDQIPSKVYRGQGLSNEDFEKLKKAPGGLLSFNSFISTSVKEYIAKEFFPSLLHDGGKKAILFEINIDPSVSSVSFTPVRDVSAIPGEEEILFSMSTVFRITKIEEIEGCIWRVNLSFTNEKDPLLKRLTDHMRISLGSGNGWRRLGQLMIKMGQFDSALETFKVLLKEVDPDDKAENAFLHNQLGYILKQKDQLEEAFSHYQESLQINLTYMSDIDPRLSSTYSNIGGILKKLGDTNGALKFYELVLKIDLAAPEPNPLEIAIDHNNIGSVLDDQGKYPEALNSYEQALQIKLAHLPPHHPSLASTYSNIGLIHQKMGDCSTALTFYQQTFQIQQKSLPPNHPSLIVTHGKLARTLEDLHRYEEAIKHAQQAVNVARLAFGASHPEVEKRQKYFNELQEKFGFH